MARYEFRWVDVFTDRQFGGNQLAVFTDAQGLDGDQMQAIARELNISETTFVLPPADSANTYRLRIFTPGQEMQMAGHPTIGTAHVLHKLGMLASTEIRFEEPVGVIPVALDTSAGENPVVWMTQPLPEFRSITEDRAIIAEALSIPVEGIRADLPLQVVSSGVPFLYIPIVDLATMQRIKFRRDVWDRMPKEMGLIGLFPFSLETILPSSTVHSRMFAPPLEIPEDPATGAASGPLGAYLVHYGLVEADQALSIISEQGMEMGRPSIVHIKIGLDGTTINHVSIGGTSVDVGGGYLDI